MNDDDVRDEDFDQASSRLVDGLRSCRSIVENYRAMISPDNGAAVVDGQGSSASNDLQSPDGQLSEA